jgi:hypothetical protein
MSSEAAGKPETADARRAALRLLCQPKFERAQPRGVNLFGWLMVALGLAAAGFGLALLAWSVSGLLRNRPLAGEHLFAGGVGVLYFLFFARLWHGFRTLPDWRTALDVPHRVKVFAALGSAISASLAAGAAALAVFAICAKQTFLNCMDFVGAGDVGKIQVILATVGAAFLFLVGWYLFQALAELREWARAALATVLAATVALAIACVVADGAGWLADGVRTVTLAVSALLGGLAAVGLVLQACLATGRDVAKCFHAYEFERD